MCIRDRIETESDYSILAEESGLNTDNLPDIFWVVDPLDGTANYSRDIPICCVSIALISGLKPVLGVIYDFNNEDLYEGSTVTKALLNNDKITVSSGGNLKFEFNEQGTPKFVPQNTAPNAVSGGMFYSGSDVFFVGFNN